jgi:hypothetical protein
MTGALTVGEVGCGRAGSDQDAHNPLLPLIIGDTTTGNYTSFDFDPLAQVLTIQVVTVSSTATYTLDAFGTILIDGQDLIDTAPLDAAVLAAQTAAAAAAASAVTANTAATNAGDAVGAAIEAANNAANSAQLSADYATAPETVSLPNGGVSSLVSSQRANQVALVARDLDIGGVVTASEFYDPSFCDTERQVTATTAITITVPPNIYVNTDAKKRWGTYRLLGAGGSVKVVGQTGLPTVRAPTLLSTPPAFRQRWQSSGNVYPTDVGGTIAIPAVTNGLLVLIYSCQTNTTVNTLQAVPFATGISGSWSTIRALDAASNGTIIPHWACFSIPLVAFAAANIPIGVHGGAGMHSQFLQAFIVEGHGSAGQAAALQSNAAANNFSATLSSVPAQSLMLAVGLQIATTATSGFSSFDAGLAAVAFGNTNGVAETTAGNGDVTKNYQYGVGSGVLAAAAAYTAKANFTSAVGKGGIILISFNPVSTGGPSSVTVRKQGTRDTLTELGAVAELWFNPDGYTVDLNIES